MKPSDLSVEKRYPTQHARKEADEAIDSLDLDASMRTYLVIWEAAYLAAGGQVKL